MTETRKCFNENCERWDEPPFDCVCHEFCSKFISEGERAATAPVDSIGWLETLLRDWEKKARTLERRSNLAKCNVERKRLATKAGVYNGCIRDLKSKVSNEKDQRQERR